jgi:preprotein translocase subunit SecD
MVLDEQRHPGIRHLFGCDAQPFARAGDERVPIAAGRGPIAAENGRQRHADPIGTQRPRVADTGVDVAIVQARRDDREHVALFDVCPERAEIGLGKPAVRQFHHSGVKLGRERQEPCKPGGSRVGAWRATALKS